ncbi:mevalonate diphosphate decarboxylase [Phyllostomus discolor]|uniref:diphosphomevalonate decarboxylase n=1 Tax=Phyllostomus discolor TaxID=89673 RepID=A0A833YN53_9CHIR|nr:mevalonate diphosphate decarboxylase [Phyllostomus discolor]
MASEKPLVAVTCTAPVNIAVIKYWGKRDEELILPINSSLSVTLHQDQLKTTTTAAISKDFTEDQIWINGRKEDIGQPRIQACLRQIRHLARKQRSGEEEEDPLPLSPSYKVHIASVNNFPTAAGLASSAAGYACLAYTLARVYGVESDLSEVARRGSGSACRSLYGGFVERQLCPACWDQWVGTWPRARNCAVAKCGQWGDNLQTPRWPGAGPPPSASAPPPVLC